MNIKPIPHHPLIDGIRGLCIISVILNHLSIHLPLPDAIKTLLPHAIYTLFFQSGYYGVIIFFVISGFLITQSAIKHFGSLNAIAIPAFYRLRFARIAPCLILLLIILGFANFFEINHFRLSEKHTAYPWALFSALSFQINVLQAKVNYLPAPWDVLWSLSVEECFYLFFPILCVCLPRKLFFSLLFFLIFIAPFFRVFSSNDIWADHGYFSCFDSIAIGVLAYFISEKKSKFQAYRLWILGISLSFILLIFCFRKFSFEIGISKWALNTSLLSVGIAGLFITSPTIALSNCLEKMGHALQSFGKYSYEIYLSHSFIIIGFKSMMKWMPLNFIFILFIYCLAMGLCYCLGSPIARYFSIPMNQYLRQGTLTH